MTTSAVEKRISELGRSEINRVLVRMNELVWLDIIGQCALVMQGLAEVVEDG